MNSLTIAIAQRTDLPERSVNAVLTLLENGATIPFIARYRKEATGNLDELAILKISQAKELEQELEHRREFIIGAISDAVAMNEKIHQAIISAKTLQALEDIYAPFKPKRRTRATIAREAGYEPLAKKIMSGHLQRLNDSDDAIQGAKDIIAEWVSDSSRMRNIVRRGFHRQARLTTTPVAGKEGDLGRSVFANYVEFSRRPTAIESHQYLAIRRAEREDLLKVKWTFNDENAIVDELCRAYIPANATDTCAKIIGDAVADSYKRLLKSSVENEIATELKGRSDTTAIAIFSENLRALLMEKPLRGKRILAIDPGFRTGCKVVALDAEGQFLEDTVIYPVAPYNDKEGAYSTLQQLIAKHHLDVIALGNGTAGRETQQFLISSKTMPASNIFMVSENGASVYSASEIAREEFPTKDVTVRGAASIGRRLIDPLAELVKIDPKSIGVGQYQHDVDQSELRDALDFTVMSCVNSVGVDVNTASAKLLSYISGIGTTLANGIVAFRNENGPFTSRAALKKVPRLGDKAFEQAAGFLRIPNSENILDRTGIHPENYSLIEELAHKFNKTLEEFLLMDWQKIPITELTDRGISKILATELQQELSKPGRDPRLETSDDQFEPSISSFEDIRQGMEINGRIANITAFGAFVDLGIKESGLVHISELSNKRPTAVSDVVKLGQLVRVRVIDVDNIRHRIALSMKNICQ